ncbi:MAG: peptidylprolyl isomerase, partial [Chitinophagaceae bacterium]
MKRFIWIACAIFCLYSTASAQKATIDKVVAVIGGNPILLSDLNQQYTLFLNQGNPPNPTIKCYILQQMLAQKLLKQQAEIDSVMVEEPEVDDELDRRMRAQVQRAGGQENLERFLGRSILQYKDELRPDIKEQLISNKMQNKITANISVTPLEVKKYYESYSKDSLPDIGAEVEVGEIVFYPSLTKEEKQKYFDKIEALRVRVKNGEDFGFLARTYSEDTGSAGEGGDLGFFDRGQMVKEFTATAFKLKAGEVSSVFESEHGYHFLQVIERRGEQVHARHILIRPQTPEQSLQRVKLRADSVYRNIQDKKLTFTTAASVHSDNKETKFNGGMILYADNVTQRTTYTPVEKLDPAVFVVIDTMKTGAVSTPVKFTGADGRQGYKLLYLKSKVPPHKANLDQ